MWPERCRELDTGPEASHLTQRLGEQPSTNLKMRSLAVDSRSPAVIPAAAPRPTGRSRGCPFREADGHRMLLELSSLAVPPL